MCFILKAPDFSEFFEKQAARKEIKMLRAGLLSENEVQQLAVNNEGQNERLISRLGSGSNHNADKVLLPGHGIAVRKTLKSNHDPALVSQTPEHKALHDLKVYQDSKGHGGGFAKVLKIDDKSGMSFHELIGGSTVHELPTTQRLHVTEKGFGKNLVDAPDKTTQGIVNRINSTNFNESMAAVEQGKVLVKKVPEDMANTVKHLQGKHPDIWDYNTYGNIKLHTDNTGSRRLTAIDFHTNNLKNTPGPVINKDPGFYFKHRQGIASGANPTKPGVLQTIGKAVSHH